MVVVDADIFAAPWMLASLIFSAGARVVSNEKILIYA